MLTYTEARQTIIQIAEAVPRGPIREFVEIEEATGCVLARDIRADRDYPPFNRSTRDGFALRSADATEPGARLACIGEIRAGGQFDAALRAGQCVEIMTGAAIPDGADAVVMIEHVRRENDVVTLDRAVGPGAHIVPGGSEARAGQVLVPAGLRMGYAELALAAQAGATRLEVFASPNVAILSTGDEVVDMRAQPERFQVRNSNGLSIEVLARRAGGRPIQLGNAPDDVDSIRQKIERGLRADILVLSGGVSMGKYDLVKRVLSDLGAEFHFSGTAIRPGRPAVFATRAGKLIFGLPGNPVSTMVTFELFVLPAIDILAGARPRSLPILRAKLKTPIREKGDLTHFLPARIEWEGREAQVAPLTWQGSGDIVALASANCFLVVGPEQPEFAADDWVDVLPRRGVL